MKVLKVMLADGRIIAYRARIGQNVVAAQMIEMSKEEFDRDYANPKPDVQTLFQNEGHLNLRA